MKVKKCRKCKVEMKYNWSDADDLGGIEEWLECPECGKTSSLPQAIVPTESAQAQAGGRKEGSGGSYE
jgi:hypothetical protein